MLRTDWVVAELVRQNRLKNRTNCNSFSPDFHVSGTFERHVTRYDWPMYRAIGRLRAGESYRVAAPLACSFRHKLNLAQILATAIDATLRIHAATSCDSSYKK